MCSVRRDGDMNNINVNEIVVGDIVILETGDKIPAHFIQEVVGKANGEEVITVHWGPAVSKNPYLTFAYNGNKGDEIELMWTDNKGNTDSKKAQVK